MDKFGDRMKRYELVSKNVLTNRMPVIIRLDGCAFHTFTKKFERPFDMILKETMNDTMLELCKKIPGCVFGYTQSDEITLILIDCELHTTKVACFSDQVFELFNCFNTKRYRLYLIVSDNCHFRQLPSA